MLLKTPRYPDIIHCFLSCTGGSRGKESKASRLRIMIKFPRVKNPVVLFQTPPLPSGPTAPCRIREHCISSLSFSPSALPHPIHERPAALRSCHSSAVSSCQKPLSPFRKKSKFLSPLNEACLSWPLPTPISCLSSLHHPRHSLLSTHELPAFPPTPSHALLCPCLGTRLGSSRRCTYDGATFKPFCRCFLKTLGAQPL